MSTAAQTPPVVTGSLPPQALPPVPYEVMDPADREVVPWSCNLIRDGQADLYA